MKPEIDLLGSKALTWCGSFDLSKGKQTDLHFKQPTNDDLRKAMEDPDIQAVEAAIKSIENYDTTEIQESIIGRLLINPNREKLMTCQSLLFDDTNKAIIEGILKIKQDSIDDSSMWVGCQLLPSLNEEAREIVARLYADNYNNGSKMQENH